MLQQLRVANRRQPPVVQASLPLSASWGVGHLLGGLHPSPRSAWRKQYVKAAMKVNQLLRRIGRTNGFFPLWLLPPFLYYYISWRRKPSLREGGVTKADQRAQPFPAPCPSMVGTKMPSTCTNQEATPPISASGKLIQRHT